MDMDVMAMCPNTFGHVGYLGDFLNGRANLLPFKAQNKTTPSLSQLSSLGFFRVIKHYQEHCHLTDTENNNHILFQDHERCLTDTKCYKQSLNGMPFSFSPPIDYISCLKKLFITKCYLGNGQEETVRFEPSRS